MICLFILFSMLLNALEATIGQEGNKAMALVQVHDFQAADSIYENLANEKLPDWQRALVLYNWGTVKLFKQEWEQALHLYQTINQSAISTPEFLRSLMVNKAFASLGQAKWVATLPEKDFSEEFFLIRQAQAALRDAEKMDCRIQSLEKRSSCLPSWDIETLKTQTAFQLTSLREEQKKLFDEETETFSPLKALIRDYQSLFLMEIAPSDLISLQKKLSSLPEDARTSDFEKAAHDLKKAIEDKHPRFYFLSSMSHVIAMQSHKTPIDILTNALLQAEVLREMMQTAFLIQETPPMLREQQARVLQAASSFIEASLKEQKEKKECQRSPWEQAIPLYEEGLDAAEQSAAWINESPFPYQALLQEQKKIVTAWKEALELLKHPPPPSSEQTQPEAGEANQNIEETMRDIQEMHAEDQPGEEGVQKGEGHTW